MPKYVELSAEETISTAELFGAAQEEQRKEDLNHGSDQKLCEHDAD